MEYRKGARGMKPLDQSPGLIPDRLRCEYLVNPLGIDAVRPRLSWIVQSGEREQGQTAYQVLVASTSHRLAEDDGDLWDSGKVGSDATLHLAYDGKPLSSRARCYWKVRVWDKTGRPSPWSKPATWTMGLLAAADWGARWIAFDDPVQPAPSAPRYGFLTTLSPSPHILKSVTLDLGDELEIDAVRLHPAAPRVTQPGAPDYTCVWEPEWPGYLFPVRFRIEVARRADFSDPATVVDSTDVDLPSPEREAQGYRFAPVRARYVRLTVTRLAGRGRANFGFALARLEVFSGSANVAPQASVTAADSVELGGWSRANLVADPELPESSAADPWDQPATMVHKEFAVGSAIEHASVSVTGLGLFELRINGGRVGDRLLAPEWTLYGTRLQYQTFDVTDLIRAGANTVGAQLSGGWWTGPVAVAWVRRTARCCLLLRLDLELSDGSTQTIVTDSSWQASNDGPIRRAGIYRGESYDATREMPGWDQPGFAAAGWSPVAVLSHPDGAEQTQLVAQCNEPIRVVKEVRPVRMTEPAPGVYVYDMGQNMVGWCRLKANAPAGTRIALRHAEMLNQDGTLYTANLRRAAQRDEYRWRGGEAVVEPHFTYHGFRYVELTGLPAAPGEEALVGRVFHSSAPDAGTFACSNDLVNAVMHCVEWGQRGNLMSVPTDCPQRDERMGFLGDFQSFSQAAIFTMDLAGFLTKWVRDIRDSQLEDGRFPVIAPHPREPLWLQWANTEFSPAWSDAGTIVPWRAYLNYADTRMLEQHYESCKRWIEFVRANNADLIWRNLRGGDQGDWLNGDMTELPDYPSGISAVPKELFATAFFAHSTEIVAKMAGVLGRTDDAREHGALAERIKAAFNREFVTADGRVSGDTQGGYALALHFGLLDEALRAPATRHLLAAIDRYHGHPSTGIHASHRMLLELTRNGRHDEAWRLMNLRTVPSWGYMVDQNATTIWERWDAYVAGRGRWGGHQHPIMNSLNHFGFGSVGEWVWRELAGINPDADDPGYKRFVIRPRPCGDLTWLKASYDSIRGTITSEWKVVDRAGFHLDVQIPANTRATVYLPAGSTDAVTEGGKPVAQVEGVGAVRVEDGMVALEVGSGAYRFLCEAATVTP